MGTISEKLTYLNQTKQKLKQAINNIGGEVTDETTFREYVNQLENAYDRLPKTEFEEGESVTLENTLKGKLDFEDGKVGFGQSSQETTTGRNLLKMPLNTITSNAVTSISQNGEIKVSGTPNQNWFTIIPKTNLDTPLPIGTYTFSRQNVSTTARLIFVSYDINGTQKNFYTSSGATQNITITTTFDTVAYGVFSDSNSTSTNLSFTDYIMLETGSTAHDWEKYTGGQASPNPSYPQTINSVTGNQDVVVSTPIEITIIENLRASTISSGNNFFYTDNNYIMRYFPIEKGKKYKVTWDYTSTETQINVYLFTENVPVVNGTYNTNDVSQINWRVTDNITFIADRDGYFVTAYSRFANTIIENFGAIQYETYQLSLGEYKFYGIGNYKDELIYDVDEDKVYKKSNTIRYTADELTWSHFSVAQGDLFRTTPIDTIKGTSGYSNYYICKTQSTRTNPCFYVNGDNPLIDVIDNRYSDTTDFKNWCVTNNVEWIIPRATPTLTELTDTTLKAQVKALYNAHSNNGTTIITSNGNLPMIIKVRGLKGE